MRKKDKVVVAMSGGVDSSVAAALLKERGFEVIGMMLRLWSEPGSEGSNRCCTPDSMALARRVAAKLDIPFYVVDAKAAFKESVVQAFLDGYGRGETPNPCLVCNREIRWTFLMDHALALGADFMATGHYARTRQHEQGGVNLLRAVDAAKDQSYVLHVLDQQRLSKAIFPIGDFVKADVRSMAQAFSLPTASRRDSQDLCFLAGGDYRDFIQRNRPEMLAPGKIIAVDGALLGEHRGLAHYTVGQRKGLGLASPAPLYVLRKDVEQNSLIVGLREARGLQELTTGAVNWIMGKAPTEPFRAEVKIRYTARETPGLVIPLEDGSGVRILFDEPQADITRGQAAVFYQNEIVMGGGIIQ
jgi:tRNA-specific 2-thiouridylase